ncbi:MULTISPECIES: polyprenyl synthetase family protein [Paenibacillus]|uniref:Farnesyl diphosphate synthase n=1 Tax=Paenibacillus xylanilyticus TaxID=248903 RepID=A0A7Y6BW01_9BACL|nr:farnesyl diphosphate synthase [Paenibacillus xylanilyticus]NUU75831.1 polyprenyl synthetase family protein [Paenibacillus xylanilyticus]
MSSRLSFEQYLQNTTDQVTEALKEVIPVHWDVPQSLRDAMQYSLMAGGKRLRPLLVVAAAEALGAQRTAAFPVACAVEMVHTYSLIHDDLPAMDNDDYRRGKLTNHKVYGEATAILAGDALLTHAFYCVVQAGRKSGVPAEALLSIVEDLSELAGARGMVGGQVADMEGEQGMTDLEQLQYIHMHKTGDLIVFSLLAGARIGGATEGQLEALRVFGRDLGLAFQIQDDILDLTGDEQKMGKKTQSDVNQQKVTYPFFIGMEASLEQVRLLTQSAKDALGRAELQDSSRLMEIADYLMRRDH